MGWDLKGSIPYIIIIICRFTHEGWVGAEATDMMGIWDRLPRADVARVMKLEMLDENELLTQLFTHYCITTAWTDTRWTEITL